MKTPPCYAFLLPNCKKYQSISPSHNINTDNPHMHKEHNTEQCSKPTQCTIRLSPTTPFPIMSLSLFASCHVGVYCVPKPDELWGTSWCGCLLMISFSRAFGGGVEVAVVRINDRLEHVCNRKFYLGGAILSIVDERRGRQNMCFFFIFVTTVSSRHNSAPTIRSVHIFDNAPLVGYRCHYQKSNINHVPTRLYYSTFNTFVLLCTKRLINTTPRPPFYVMLPPSNYFT